MSLETMRLDELSSKPRTGPQVFEAVVELFAESDMAIVLDEILSVSTNGGRDY